MNDVVDREVPIADENMDPNGHPAKNMFGDWSESVSGTLHDAAENDRNLTEEEREKRIKEMEVIIKKELKE